MRLLALLLICLLLNGCVHSLARLQPEQSVLASGAFDFNWQLSGDPAVAPLQIFNNRRQVWLQFDPNQHLPAIFAYRNGQQHAVRYQRYPPYVVVEGDWQVLLFQGGHLQAVAQHASVSTADLPMLQPLAASKGSALAKAPQTADEATGRRQEGSKVGAKVTAPKGSARADRAPAKSSQDQAQNMPAPALALSAPEVVNKNLEQMPQQAPNQPAAHASQSSARASQPSARANQPAAHASSSSAHASQLRAPVNQPTQQSAQRRAQADKNTAQPSNAPRAAKQLATTQDKQTLAASVESSAAPRTTSRAGSSAPQQRFSLGPDDETLRQALQRWAQQVGWHFDNSHWALEVDYPIMNKAQFTASFPDAVEQVLDSVRLGAQPLRACFYSNQVLRIIPESHSCHPTGYLTNRQGDESLAATAQEKTAQQDNGQKDALQF